MAGDPVSDALGTFDPLLCRVIASPAYIVLFGGKVSVKPEDKYSSVRNVLISHIVADHNDIASQLLIPEEYPEWNHFGVYPDLLAFEEDLAHLTSLVVLVCESPGAIAELGSFALLEPLRDKLFVVVGQNHFEADSFIKLGPIRRIQNHHSDAICVIPWDSPQDFEAHLPVVIAELRARLKTPPKTTKFSPASHGHTLLAIADAIDLLSIVRLKDIREFLQALHISIDETTLNRYLFLLEKLKIVRSIHYGTNRFYAPGERRGAFLDYTAPEESPRFDRARVKTNCYSAWDKWEPSRMFALMAKTK